MVRQPDSDIRRRDLNERAAGLVGKGETPVRKEARWVTEIASTGNGDGLL